MENKIKIFENKQVRTAWNADQEEWYGLTQLPQDTAAECRVQQK